MVIITYCLAVLLFCAAFYLTHLIASCNQVITIAKTAVKTIADKNLDDYTKEKATQEAAIGMLKGFFVLGAKIAVILGLTILPLWLADAAGLASFTETSEFSLRLDVLAVTTVTVMAIVFLWRKLFSRKQKRPMASGADYSLIDRALHKLSFGSTILQDVLTDIEVSLYSDNWKDFAASNPVFITSLPRAGTTIILEALNQLPGLATHTYRDMPFIHTPVLWNKLSAGIRSQGVRRERAHGDGLFISEDSPEAFEEVLWRKYFPKNYSDSRISLWDSGNSEFTRHFREHMQKIAFLRHPDELNKARYVSKNNANIARTAVIKEMFPDSSVIIPLRKPIEHAISMWRQHKNFLKQQADDKFVTRYMADIGHYEFGNLHRPIQFPQLDSILSDMTPNSLDYWIAYWIAAFEHLSKQDGIAFLSYENLCQSPENGLGKLCQHIELYVPQEAIAAAATIFRSPPDARIQQHDANAELMNHAEQIHHNLLSRCLLNQ